LQVEVQLAADRSLLDVVQEKGPKAKLILQVRDESQLLQIENYAQREGDSTQTWYRISGGGIFLDWSFVLGASSLYSIIVKSGFWRKLTPPSTPHPSYPLPAQKRKVIKMLEVWAAT